jgi:hypothetical protein
MKRITLILAMAASISAAACLQKDTTSTIYLRQDGSLDWVVLEQDVRSDEIDPAKRTAEETAYVDAAARGEHGVAEGFLALGADDVRIRWLRSTRPYAVMVDARFESLTAIFERQLTACRIPHEIGSTQDGDVTTWKLWIDAGPDGEGLEGDHGDGCDDGFEGLTDAMDITIVLESGRFTNAAGFTLEGADTAVVDQEGIETACKTTGQIEFSLSWTAVPQAGSTLRATQPKH